MESAQRRRQRDALTVAQDPEPRAGSQSYHARPAARRNRHAPAPGELDRFARQFGTKLARDAAHRREPLIRTLQHGRGFACLFISHDLGAVAEVADRVAVMQSGRIVEEGSRNDVFDRSAHAYTRALLAAVPRLEGERVLNVIK